MKVLKPLSRKVELDNESYLYFGGTAYLGIPQHAAFLQLYLEGLKRFGLNNGTSRGNNVQLGIYDEAEQFAATKFGADDCLITSSGYLAAQLTVKYVSKLGELRYAPATHPALWINEPPKTNGSFTDWTNAIVEEINRSTILSWVIVSNSLNNLYPEVYDFSFLERISSEKRIILVVDDSHGIGLINEGIGAFSKLPQLENVDTVVVASMAKALGVDAGLVLASHQHIHALKHSNEFLGASPPSAAGLFAFMNATAIYEEEHAKLVQLTSRFNRFLSNDSRWKFETNFPVFLTSIDSIKEKLMEQKILISSFAYPDKNGSLLNRIVLSSWHTLADIEELILALTKIY